MLHHKNKKEIHKLIVLNDKNMRRLLANYT